MNSFNPKQTEAKDVRLDPKDHAALRQSLLALTEEATRPYKGSVRQSWSLGTWFHFPKLFPAFSRMRLVPALAIFLLLVTLGGGVAFAAESALPGDLLYPIKIHVVEEVRATFTFSPLAKSQWEIRRAERRLEEAETLSEHGAMTAPIVETITKNFNEHTGRVHTRIQTLEMLGQAQPAAELSAALEAPLRAHTAILSALVQTNPKNVHEAQQLSSSVETERIKIKKLRISAESTLVKKQKKVLRSSAEKHLNTAEEKINAVRILLENQKKKKKKEEKLKLDDMLSTAEQSIEKGKEELNAGASTNAFLQFQDAERSAEEAKVLLRAQEKFKIDLEPLHPEKREEQKNDQEEKDKKEIPMLRPLSPKNHPRRDQESAPPPMNTPLEQQPELPSNVLP